MAGMAFNAEPRRDGGGALKPRQFMQRAGCEMMGIRSGVQFDDGRADAGGGFNLRLVRVDEQ